MNAEGGGYENMGSFFFAGKTLTFMETIIFLGGINYEDLYGRGFLV